MQWENDTLHDIAKSKILWDYIVDEKANDRVCHGREGAIAFLFATWWALRGDAADPNAAAEPLATRGIPFRRDVFVTTGGLTTRFILLSWIGLFCEVWVTFRGTRVRKPQLGMCNTNLSPFYFLHDNCPKRWSRLWVALFRPIRSYRFETTE